MTENKRFWVENERILNTYILRIFKEDEIIFEINNWNSLHESNKVECEGIANELNELSEENEELKKENKELRQDNDIKFWKLQFMKEYNSHQLIMHELSRAIDAGYTISDEFQKYLDSLREQNKKNIEKAERLGI